MPKSVIRLWGNESSDTQIGVEEASDGANTDVDLDAAYPSDSTQGALYLTRITLKTHSNKVTTMCELYVTMVYYA